MAVLLLFVSFGDWILCLQIVSQSPCSSCNKLTQMFATVISILESLQSQMASISCRNGNSISWHYHTLGTFVSAIDAKYLDLQRTSSPSWTLPALPYTPFPAQFPPVFASSKWNVSKKIFASKSTFVLLFVLPKKAVLRTRSLLLLQGEKRRLKLSC